MNPQYNQRKRIRRTRRMACDGLERRELLSADMGATPDLQISLVQYAETAEATPSGNENAFVTRIVNGTPTDEFPEVGIVNHGCSGTLISSQHVLTAAHCTIDVGERRGTFQVNGETFGTVQMYEHPMYDDWNFSAGYDLSVMVLDRPVEGITPRGILREAPEVGDVLTLVGFGQTGSSLTGSNYDFGNQHMATTPIDGVTDTHIEWTLDTHTEGNTAPGDSGGPAFIDVNGTLLIAGVTSGGTAFPGPFGLGDLSFDTRVDMLAAWVDEVVAADIPVRPADDHPDVPGPGATELLLDNTGSASIEGVLNDYGDRDVFQFTLDTTAITVISLDGHNGYPDTYLRLYDHDGNWIAGNDDYGYSLDSQLETVLPPGLYYVSAGAYLDGDVGNYRLDVSTYALPDDVSEPLPVTLNDVGDASIVGSLEYAGDHDEFDITIGHNSVVEIDLAGSFSGLDTVLGVYDAQGDLIAFNDDHAGTLNSRLELRLNAGTYRIRAGSFGNGGVGLYRMSINTRTVSDLNDDGRVDAADAGLLFADWGGGGDSDLNQDGIVDGLDSGILFGDWSQPEGGSSSAELSAIDNRASLRRARATDAVFAGDY